jgi:hypothetical protein
MSLYTTYFSSPVQVGTAVDNLQTVTGIGDVTLSQAVNLPLTTSSPTVTVNLPAGVDLHSITVQAIGAPASGGEIYVSIPNSMNNPATTGGLNGFVTPVAFNADLASIYKLSTPVQIVFTCHANVGGPANLVARVSYSFRP